MSTDLERALAEIAALGGRDASPVPVGRLLARLHRRRAARDVTLSAAGVGAAAALVLAGAATIGGRDIAPPTMKTDVPIATASPSPSPSPAPSPTTGTADLTPLPGWTPGTAPCGEPVGTVPVDSPVQEIRGEVTVGTYDPVTARFTHDPSGTTVHVGVTVYPETPGQPVDGQLDQRTYLLDAEGRVALWNSPSDSMPPEATDGSGGSAIAGLYDAVDCRTGRPLEGTYRAVATAATSGTAEIPGPVEPDVEVVELAPVTLGPLGTSPAGPALGVLPVCGSPAPRELLAGSPDLAITLDPAARLDAVSLAGLHVDVTVTRPSQATGRLAGSVPQDVLAVLVDAAGTVVTGIDGRSSAGPQPFDVGPGESFSTELYQWFSPCLATGALLEPGEYDLYVYDELPATDERGTTASRLVTGGPFPVTVVEW